VWKLSTASAEGCEEREDLWIGYLQERFLRESKEIIRLMKEWDSNDPVSG
jgi:hypothetical protein